MAGGKKVFVRSPASVIHELSIECVDVEIKESQIEIRKKFFQDKYTLFHKKNCESHYDSWFELCRAIKKLAEWEAKRDFPNAVEMWEKSIFYDYYTLYLEVHG